MTGWRPDRPLPKNWKGLRKRRLNRDGHRCQLAYEDTCTGRATEVHHAGDPHDHRIEQLLSVCHECHEVETQRQSAEATRALWAQTKRRPKPHPGLL
ncbi:hypothetical protein GCM10022234_00280 [Aeromicrobium panaciterrae]